MPVRAAAALDGFYVAASFEATAQEALRACARPKTAPVLKKLLCQKTQALIQIQSGEFLLVQGVTGGGRALLQVSLALSPDGEALADRELGNPWDESDAPIAERSWRAIIVGFVGGKFADKNKEVQVVGVVANAMGIRKVVVQEADVARRPTEVDVSAPTIACRGSRRWRSGDDVWGQWGRG